MRTDNALIQGFALLLAAIMPVVASGAFNVRDFGAKGDGLTDDTAAFQAAIDAVAAQGAGKVVVPYSPKGYRIAGPGRAFVAGRPCRGQLVIPPVKGLNIAFEGEMPCKLLYSYQVRPPTAVKSNFTPTKFGTMGMPNTCLFSDWTPPEERDPTARPWTILATVEGNSCKGKFSVAQVSIANLEFRAHLDKETMYPKGGCVNLQNASRANVRDAQFCLDDNVGDTFLGKSLQPNPCHTVGLMMSGDQNDNQVLNNVAVQGFRYGLVLGEHVVADYLYVHNCEEGIVFHDATHQSVVNHVVAQHNRVILSTTVTNLFGHSRAPCNVIVGSLNFESGRNLLPEVSRLVYGIRDPENRLRGSLMWHQPWGDGQFPIDGARDFKVSRFPATPDTHPWSGKKVVYLGDSITDPTQIERHKHKVYWNYLQELYGLQPHVYAISGYQWNHIYPMAQKMRAEMGDAPDAILILLGTNDYNSGVPLGEWFTVAEEDVNRRGVTIRQPRRHFAKNMGTFRGRINTVMEYLKQNFPDQQIVIMTPLHRGYANFGNANVQPPECFPNVLGLYLEDYVNALREAADIWAVPLIDLYRDSGLYPADPAYAKYFRDGGEQGKDNLHPNGLGHLRMAHTIAAKLRTLPPDFKEQ